MTLLRGAWWWLACSALLFGFGAGAALSAGDIYGFVDEQGIAHLSDVRVDDRYFLFIKGVPAPVAASATDVRTQQGVPGEPRLASRRPYADLVSRVAAEQGVDAALIDAVIAVESAHSPRAKSPKGASGLMQLMPATAQRYGVTDIWNPLENIRGGARYLRYLLELFKNDLQLVLAAYNAGEAAVISYGNKIPPYPETRKYVPRVLQDYERNRVRS
jgi:soluble lytic murein transglycosylase-like protein